MERLTHERNNGIKQGYWSHATKEELVQRLAAYENTGYAPEEIPAAIDQAKREGENQSAVIMAQCIAEAMKDMLDSNGATRIRKENDHE